MILFAASAMEIKQDRYINIMVILPYPLFFLVGIVPT